MSVENCRSSPAADTSPSALRLQRYRCTIRCNIYIENCRSLVCCRQTRVSSSALRAAPVQRYTCHGRITCGQPWATPPAPRAVPPSTPSHPDGRTHARRGTRTGTPRCFLRVAFCVRCTLHVARCRFHVACNMSSVACCNLSVVCTACMPSHVVRRHVACRPLSCCMSSALMLHVVSWHVACRPLSCCMMP